jgi:ketosteroid isomerase-like protein
MRLTAFFRSAPLLLAAAALMAGPVSPKVEAEIKAAEKSWVDAMLKNDTKTLDKLLGDDLMYTHSDTRLETKADVIRTIGDGSHKYSSIEITDQKYRQYDDTVVATHKIFLNNVKSGMVRVYVTHVWAKTRGGWQLVNRQSTRLPAQ